MDLVECSAIKKRILRRCAQECSTNSNGRLRAHGRPVRVVQATKRDRVSARTAAVRVLATLPREDDATAATETSTLEISEESLIALEGARRRRAARERRLDSVHALLERRSQREGLSVGSWKAAGTFQSRSNRARREQWRVWREKEGQFSKDLGPRTIETRKSRMT